MKKVYALCLLILTVVVLDIVFFHSPSVTAQSNQAVRIERVWFSPNDVVSRTAPIFGRVVGFHCVESTGGPQCFVASGNVPAAGSSQ
jgi:hypothetical protein